MITTVKTVLSAFRRKPSEKVGGKSEAELNFWKEEIENYVEWYLGEKTHCGFQSPKEADKFSGYGLPLDAVITWLRLYQQQKYLADLQISVDQFRGMRILDIGCGPFPSICVFEGAEYYGLDPLAYEYRAIGYPIGLWGEQGFHFVVGRSERMSFDDNSFEVVISVNAIDHVDDFALTAIEVRRVLKADGILRMHVHYHRKTTCEPIELKDRVFLDHYGWVPNLRKICQSRTKDMGLHEAPQGELYVLWGNS